jgi:hypothetical protein
MPVTSQYLGTISGFVLNTFVTLRESRDELGTDAEFKILLTSQLYTSLLLICLLPVGGIKFFGLIAGVPHGGGDGGR